MAYDLDPARNPLIANRQGLIGKGVDRVDGPLKVCGAAPYAYEFAGEGRAAYGFIVGATIAKGRVVKLDTAAAEAAPGVLMVMTHRNAPQQERYGPFREPAALERAKPYLVDADIRYYGQPIAFVVAQTFETARAAAKLISVRYERTQGAYGVAKNIDTAYAPQTANAGIATDSALGDFDAAFTAAPVQIDAIYTTPYQHHSAMEPHAAMAVWDGGKLTLYASTQLAMSCQASLVKTLRLKPEDVRVLCPYIGGGFGGKLPTGPEMILSALAARELGRAVKTALTRQQTFHNCTHRPESVQRIRFGADASGTLDAIAHEVWEQTSMFDEFAEQTVAFGRSLYAAPHRLTRTRVVKLDLPSAGAMRAPGEAIGLLTYECAMDELAHQLGMDPIDLRLRNDAQEDPERKQPFSSRNLAGCLREGAERFGWNKRQQKPGSVRDGRWLIGYGVASAIRPNYLRPSKARVRINADGRVVAQLAMTDIGTGSYTILTQITAEAMGLPMSQVKIEMGDSDLPPTPGSGGSFGAASSGSGLYEACMTLRRKLAELAVADAGSPLHGAEPAQARFTKQRIAIGERAESLAKLVARVAPQGVEAMGEIKPGVEYKDFSQQAFGAHFAEVAVDVDTAEIRMRRMLGVFAAGRILNAKTARSQMIGGMIWGIGSALTEESVVDPRYGLYINHDLAEYHVPVHADAPDVDAIFLDEHDDKTNPMGIKGVGELGICGAGAAVGNAVFNATGVRVRDFPITLDKVLKGMLSA